MPGVPTYRGCDACRKQKKKCDQASPACSRCARLKIPCIGCGQLRYKFKDQSASVKSLSKSHNQVVPLRQNENPSSVLSNKATTRSSAFVSLLEIEDPGYDLSCYGGWFKDLPRRLGTNEALDAAVDAMAGFYPYLRTRQLSRASVVKYVNALQALRTCLSNPEKARNPETLCAIYLIMICQGWTGRDGDQKMSHGEGLAHLLEATASKGHPDEFETLIRDTLVVPVILESIFNPRIRLTQWFTKITAQAFGPPPPLTRDKHDVLSLELINLAMIPDVVRDPVGHMEGMKYSYQRMRLEMPLLRRVLKQVDEFVSGKKPTELSPSTLARMHLSYQASWSLLLTSALVFNGFLRALGADDGFMAEEADTMATEAVTLAENASRYRPLGASFVPLCLVPAWAATDDPELQHQVVKALEMYQDDFTPLMKRGWYIMACWLKGQMDLVRCGLPTSVVEDYHDRQWGTLIVDENGDHVVDGTSRGWFDV